jgi:hypothetical protein
MRFDRKNIRLEKRKNQSCRRQVQISRKRGLSSRRKVQSIVPVLSRNKVGMKKPRIEGERIRVAAESIGVV